MEATKTLCPSCESPFVVPVAPATLLDRLASLISVWPFQCELCKRRFRIRKAGGPPSGQKERRKSVRVPVRIPVTFESNEASGEGTLTDISPHGCSLVSTQPLRCGMVLRLTLPVGAGQKPGETTQQLATVMGVNGNRAGLKFLAYSSQERDALAQTVTRSMKIYSSKTIKACPWRHPPDGPLFRAGQSPKTHAFFRTSARMDTRAFPHD